MVSASVPDTDTGCFDFATLVFFCAHTGYSWPDEEGPRGTGNHGKW